MTRPNYSTEPKKNLSGFWYIVVRYVSGTPLAGDPGTISGSMKTIHSHLRGDIEHGWRCGILQPNISSCLEGFPNRCGLDERKGPMIFGAIFGAIGDTGLENVSPVKYGYVWFLR